MKKYLFFIGLTVILAGCNHLATTEQEAMPIKEEVMIQEQEEMPIKEEVMIQEQESVVQNNTMVKPTKSVTKYLGTVLAGKSAPLIDFNKSDYDAALKSGKLVVLYFYANWCPICKKELPNAVYPAFNALTTDKVIGFRVNYNDDETDDNEKSLARQFGVAYQHTKVFVKNGKRILKAPDAWSKDKYLSEIAKALKN